MKRERALIVSGSSIFVVLLLLLFLFEGACAQPTQTKPKEYTLTCVSSFHSNEEWTKCFIVWIDTVRRMVAQKYPGQLKLVYKGGPEAIPPMQQAEAIKSRVIDIGFGTMAYIQGAMPLVAGQKLTQLTPLEEVKSGYVKFINEIMEKTLNQVYLGRIGQNLGYYLYLKKPITKLDDLRGLIIRTSPHHSPGVKALGGKPVILMTGEIYGALERGVIDGIVFPSVGLTILHLEEFLKYKVMPDWYMLDIEFRINRDSFYSLPKHLQELLRDATIEIMEKGIAWWDEREKAEHSLLLARGMKVIEFSPTEKARYVQIINDAAWEDFRNLCSADLVEKTRQLLTKKK